jgi:hypothetical protein
MTLYSYLRRDAPLRLVSGMLGQHPQMYAFPELYLTIAATMREWWIRCGRGRTDRHHGLLRAVAQLFFHEQTEASVAKAWDWINARFQWETTAVFHALMERIEPKMAVEKSPALATREEFLARVLDSFPKARFLHITRHPRGTCDSMFRFDYSIYLLAQSSTAYDFSTDPPTLDPQMWWYETHKRIRRFYCAAAADA